MAQCFFSAILRREQGRGTEPNLFFAIPFLATHNPPSFSFLKQIFAGIIDPRDSPPLPHPPTMLHPALLAAAHHGNSPDYGHIRTMDNNDRNSDCNSADITYDGIQPTISFSNEQYLQ